MESNEVGPQSARRLRAAAARVEANGDWLASGALREVLREAANALREHLMPGPMRKVYAGAVAQFATSVERLGDAGQRTGQRQELNLALRAAVNVVFLLERAAAPLAPSEVLANLLSNAIKYSPGGGRIRVEAAAIGSEVRIAVSDEGVGIAAAEQAQLFEPFRRASRSGDIPGTGLGLFVVSRLVKAHGGRIVIDSHEGLGSTFVVFLPRVRPPVGKADTEAASPQRAVARGFGRENSMPGTSTRMR